MNAGVPGLGISGLFFIFSVLFMPVHKLLKGSKKLHQSWRVISVFFVMNLLIIGMIVLTSGVTTILIRHSRTGIKTTGHNASNTEGVRLALPIVLLMLVAATIIVSRQRAGQTTRLLVNERTPTPQTTFVQNTSPSRLLRPAESVKYGPLIEDIRPAHSRLKS